MSTETPTILAEDHDWFESSHGREAAEKVQAWINGLSAERQATLISALQREADGEDIDDMTTEQAEILQESRDQVNRACLAIEDSYDYDQPDEKAGAALSVLDAS